MPQLATEIAAVWFGPSEQALAVSLGIIISYLGAAIAFLQPALLMKNMNFAEHLPEVSKIIKVLIYSQSSLCILMLLVVLLLFREAPLYSPSIAQSKRKSMADMTLYDL